MELIDERMQILNARPELPWYERAVLKLTISFLDQTEHYYLDRDDNWHVRMTPEEFCALPGSYWEFGNGQPTNKD